MKLTHKIRNEPSRPLLQDVTRIGSATVGHYSNPEELLIENGIDAILVSKDFDISVDKNPKVILVDTTQFTSMDFRSFHKQTEDVDIPIIALVDDKSAPELATRLGFSDFIFVPVKPFELLIRSQMAIMKMRKPETSGVIKVGGLTIDPARYEVYLSGKRIYLRFKEYELLKLMASNPGHVYTREALLNAIWGYDYFGGTRTVDVHIRRLRSKISDSDNAFIETVWQVGYRWRDDQR
ncbi:MAG: response regulator transcription factor [Chloroflexota bacterium]|nr:response regulator transcription factor [Chloroflexota bacterium]